MLARRYMRAVAADQATIEAGTTYLIWFVPALALQFAVLVMSSALRGTGIVRPTMIVQALAVGINIALAPVLIAGWGTGWPLGVAGAGLASSIAVLIGVAMLWIYFHRLERYVGIDRRLLRPQLRQWKRILNIGLPAGGEFAMMFANMGVIYYALSGFGAAAQAGFGIGSRVMGLIQVPAMAIAFAAGPIAGQNFGAGNSERVRETFRKVALIGSGLMLTVTLAAQWRPALLLGGLAKDAETMAVAALFLQMVSLNLVAQGLIFVCSAMFPGVGQHQAGAAEFRRAPVHLRDAGDMAVRAIGVSHRRRLVSVDRHDHAAGGVEFVAAAPGIRQTAGAARTMKRE